MHVICTGRKLLNIISKLVLLITCFKTMPKIKTKRKTEGGTSLYGSKGNVTKSPYFEQTQNRINHVDSPTIMLPLLPVVKLQEEFFNQDCLHLAKGLLGQLIVHKTSGVRLSGFVVETECYLGKDDAASHSYQGNRTPRNEPMFMKPGTSYVYSIYGMYHCFNISSAEDGSCVLIRALQPYENMDAMNELRQVRRPSKKILKLKDLCNGPSKLCLSLKLAKEICNKLDMATSDTFWVEKGPSIPENKIVATKRIGIDSAGPEWANKLLRFYILDNPNVSVRDKKAELLMQEQLTLQLNDPT